MTGLKASQYTLKINGVPAATLPAKQLETGVNLTALAPSPQASGVNPIAAQGRAILAAVTAKETLVSQWRSLSQKAHAAGACSRVERATGGPDDEGGRSRRRHPHCRSASKAAFRDRCCSVILSFWIAAHREAGKSSPKIERRPNEATESRARNKPRGRRAGPRYPTVF